MTARGSLFPHLLTVIGLPPWVTCFRATCVFTIEGKESSGDVKLEEEEAHLKYGGAPANVLLMKKQLENCLILFLTGDSINKIAMH